MNNLTFKTKTPNKIVISLTGHRPDNLFGYGDHPAYAQLATKLYEIGHKALNTYEFLECHSGMALGADMIWAETIVKLKKDFPNRVTFIADIPSDNQSSKWSTNHKNKWKDLIDQADDVKSYEHTSTKYAQLLKNRNIGLVDACDLLIAVANPNQFTGGTAHAISYAKSKNTRIYSINPRKILEETNKKKDQNMTKEFTTQTPNVLVLGFLAPGPDKLWGYRLSSIKYQVLKNKLRDIVERALKTYTHVELHSGLALGADTLWANLILELQAIYGDDAISFIADIPSEKQADTWTKKDYDTWNNFLTKANAVNNYYKEGMSYTNALIARDNGIIDKCDLLIAVYDETIPTIKRTLDYATNTNTRIYCIKPSEIEV